MSSIIKKNDPLSFSEIRFENFAASRYFFALIGILACILITDIIGSDVFGFDVSLSILSGGVVGLSGPAALFFLISRMKRYAVLCKKIYMHRWLPGLLCMIYFIVFSSAALLLQSLCVALDAPLVDDLLIRSDAWLGFHWTSWAAWYTVHPAIMRLSYGFYALWMPQIFFSIAVLSLAGRTDDLLEFIFLFCGAVVLSIVVGGVFPAADPFLHFGLVDMHDNSPWSQFYPLRSGELRSIDFKVQQGLVSLPSMHAVAAVLFAYSLRNIRFLFVVSIVVNFLMLISAIYCGAHYLVDIISGAGLSFLLIFLSQKSKKRNQLACAGEKPTSPE